MATPADLARRLYESYQARDWTTAAGLLHDDAELEMPATGERYAGCAAIMRLQSEYPEPWGDLRVLRVLGDDGSAAVEVEIRSDEAVFRCAAFWTADPTGLRHGVEYWVTLGAEQPGPRPRPPAS